jgi:DNA modification methylase
MNKVTLLQGHVLPVLQSLPAESVQCCVTSPPYWGLRDYGLEPQVWGGEEGCEHSWSDKSYRESRKNDDTAGPKQKSNTGSEGWRNSERLSQFCRLCGAWRGSYGLEPTIELYIEHTVQIFREVRRVLRKDGVLFLNLGDSYAGGGRAGKDGIQKWGGIESGNQNRKYGPPINTPGLKPKDLCMIPARVALALQADGWWLRSDIIWAKPNAMPESCTDRPTTAHEHIFLLTKSERYFFDAEAVKEECVSGPSDIRKMQESKERIGGFYKDNDDVLVKASKHTNIGRKRSVGSPNGRNCRSVWEFATEPFPGSHFAVFPKELVRRCISAGTSEKGCCPACGAPWKRGTEKTGHINKREAAHQPNNTPTKVDSTGWKPTNRATNEWAPTCTCAAGEPQPCVCLDPFSGAGTTALVAAKLGRDAIGIELNPDYVEMSRKRLKKDLGMFCEITP